jgi:hypothetical protein
VLRAEFSRIRRARAASLFRLSFYIVSFRLSTCQSVVARILPAERHPLFLAGQQARIGNGYAIGVATEVAQHLHGTAESRLGTNHPVVAVEAAKQLRELPPVGESDTRAGTL